MLVGLTVVVDPAVDPSAVAFASRQPGEDWFCFEQPDRGGAALAALGAVRRLEASGPGRFAEVAAAWRALAGGAVAGSPDGPAGAGLVAVGGFAFAPEGGAAPHWAGFGAGGLVVPEVALARRDGEVRLTLAALAAPDDVPEELADRIAARAAGLRERPLPLLDPAPAGRFRIASGAPPEHYEEAVARAVERIRSGALEKVVLAREVAVHAPAPHDAAATFGVLRAAFGTCFVFCAGRGDSAFVAASPELLVRREGLRASAVALAGSIRRSADPAVDDHLGEQLLGSAKDREEQAIVARRITRTLRPHAVWVDGARRAGGHQGRQHPAPRDPDPRAAHAPGQRRRARRPAAPDPGGRRRAARGGGAADPRARGHRPRLVRRAGRLDGRQRGRRVLRRAALRAAARRRRRGSTPGSASCATPTPPPSSPRPRSSSARCCRSCRAERHEVLVGHAGAAVGRVALEQRPQVARERAAAERDDRPERRRVELDRVVERREALGVGRGLERELEPGEEGADVGRVAPAERVLRERRRGGQVGAERAEEVAARRRGR